MRLLIVEDNAQMREMIKFFLTDLAEEIAECDDGAEALAAYRDFTPDYVLMDIEMKTVDGIAATRQITAADPAAQIIIVTNYNHDELRAVGQAAGACGYVLKENLIELRRWLQKPR